MKTIGITGARGFVGSHLRFLLHGLKSSYEFISIDREDVPDKERLSAKLKCCDAVVHLAGLNRGEDEQIYQTNVDITRRLLAAAEQSEKTKKFVFLSSTHNVRDTAYGKSKRDCQNLISEWGKRNARKSVSVVAPNLFGEFVKPYYNSTVATFCHELVENKESTINSEGRTELLYVQDICALILNAVEDVNSPEIQLVQGREMKVPDVYSLLKKFRDEYFARIIPVHADLFELRMFNTFRSYLYPRHFPISLDARTDNRGGFVEICKTRIGGQSSFSTTHPGIVRGNHYHTRKIERFCVISGDAIIKMRKLFTDEILEYKVSGQSPAYVDMPTFYTHSIENVGKDELLTMFWINEIFDPAAPDTFAEPVVL